jgi:hypothetical protein
VVRTSRNGACTPPRRKLNGLQSRAHLSGLITAIDGVAVPELARVVLTPALDVEIVEQRTTMSSTNRNLGRRSTDTEIDRGQRIVHLVRPVTDIGC